MKGSVIREKILAKGFKLGEVAEQLGMSSQNLYAVCFSSDNVKTETLENIAEVIGEPVSYFYSEQPIFSIEDYDEVVMNRVKVHYMEKLLIEQEATIDLLEGIITDKLPSQRLPDRKEIGNQLEKGID